MQGDSKVNTNAALSQDCIWSLFSRDNENSLLFLTSPRGVEMAISKSFFTKPGLHAWAFNKQFFLATGQGIAISGHIFSEISILGFGRNKDN